MKEISNDHKNREKQKPRTLGPVPHLEEHVNPDWWKKIFNSLYLKTDADIVDDQDITRKEIDIFYPILGLGPESHVLDLCCGQGRHSLELARRGVRNVEGLDRSHYLIHRAKNSAKKRTSGYASKKEMPEKHPMQRTASMQSCSLGIVLDISRRWMKT